jgi:hypothetical protein
MAYTPANLVLTAQAIAGPKVWTYSSVDAVGVANQADYFSDGSARGLTVGDLIYGFDSDASPVDGYLLIVSSVTAGGAATADEYAAIST